MGKKFAVKLHADQFDRLARPSQPVAAITELIWNGLDAEADRVEVSIQRTESESVESVTVRDFGHGMNSQEIDRDFVQVGGSWKRLHPMSKNRKRLMHGRSGEGRFRAFAIGHTVLWETVAEAVTGGMYRLTVRGRVGSGEFEVSDPVPIPEGTPGTVVRITEPREYVNRLTSDAAPIELLVAFTVFLLKHPNIIISYDGYMLDPNSLIARQVDVLLNDLELKGENCEPPTVRIIEWNQHGSKIKPSLLLCTTDGHVLHETSDYLVVRKDLPYTAYVMWDGFQDHARELPLADVGSAVSPVLDAARATIKDHLSHLDAQKRAQIIDRWKDIDAYPIRPNPQTPAEKRSQDLFDLVAVTAAPAVSKKSNEARLTLRLLREALEESPAELHRVLRDVVDLTPEQIVDFDELLNHTTLGDIVHTTKLVTSRLDFLVDLEHILFDKENRRRLLERKELHKILENRSWVFGEEYAVVASDKGLTRVLLEHRRLLGEDGSGITPVRGSEGNPLIVDLFLSAIAASLHDKRHLVVELKRPSVVLGMKEIGQIEEYALTIISESQFQTAGLWWDFWLIGDDMDQKAQKKARQKDRPIGVTSEGDNYRVWVRTWAEVLEENRRRMHFYKDHLNHKSPGDDALEATLSKYLRTSLAVS